MTVLLDRRDMEDMYGRYEAAMVLSAAGDALGYKNGEWEICQSGRDIQREVRNMGGLQAIHVKRKQFKSYSSPGSAPGPPNSDELTFDFNFTFFTNEISRGKNKTQIKMKLVLSVMA